MVSEILKVCYGKGFLLEKSMLEFLEGMGIDKSEEIITSLIGMGVDGRVITKSFFDKNMDKFRHLFIIRGEEKKVKSDSVRVLENVSFPSGKVGVEDFVKHFRSRFEALSQLLERRGLDALSSIRRIRISGGIYTIIAIITKKRITKNKNLLIEIEDLTGNSVILINRENMKLFEKAKGLLLDDIVAFRVSGSSEMLFGNDIIYPEISLESERYGDIDESIAFSGDFHVGSKMFLEDGLLRFIDWINGKVGDERQRSIARKVRYLILVGDNVDGIGHYSGQENDLDIKSCRSQYLKLENILRKIREDVEIIMCPGQHDAVWVGEPQPQISKKWAPGLYNMENLRLVANPALIEVGGFKILMYHGASINRFIDEIPDIRLKFGHRSPTRVVEEMLRRGHLAPTHGVMDYIPCPDGDPMVIKDTPDIIVTGDQHRAEVKSYNNILMVAGSCWESLTPFEEKVGNVPDPCKVPLFNLKTRDIKSLDFSDAGIGKEVENV